MAELDRSKKRSAEVGRRESPEFLTGADDAFRHRARDAFDLITVDEDRQFLLGQRCPDGPRGIMQGVDQSLAHRERRRLERGVLKQSSSPERALGAGDEEENGGDDGRDADFVPSAGISAQSACSPQTSPHADHDAGCRRCVGPHKDLGPHRSSSFTAVHGADAPPARSTVRRHRRSAGRRWLRRSRRR
ncbi:hypothetical protein GWK47_009017 [Chionoecetes opilio]|uniref:Uncharacterized protein n=1 Tax=Chionoecetes opilio TaxID=41210 RepID=A0A8J4XZD5_CHIOP|nr:hypothetical protein GWK47_009017 [Chionoecetes opilio]